LHGFTSCKIHTTYSLRHICDNHSSVKITMAQVWVLFVWDC